MKLKLALLACTFVLPKLLLALSQHDFAYIAETDVIEETPYYELELPTVIYETITRPDLGDLRVLNADGKVVPHGLRAPALIRNQKTEMLRARFFPLYQQAKDTPSDLHLNIKRDEKGEVINIRSQPAKEKSDSRLTGYLIDLRNWDKPVQEIKINWKATENQSFIRKLRISKSNNLERWQYVASGKTLVNMVYQNHQLKENTINISTTKSKYLRLMFEDNKPGLELESIEVSFTKSTRSKPQNWNPVSITAMDKAGEYSFTNNLKTLARELDIKLPENNTVVRVQVLSRINAEQEWRFRGSSLLYRLSVNGNSIEKSKVRISPNRDKHWLIRFDQQGGGIGSGEPQVKFSWYPQQLVFVARGEAPYRVAWGSTRVKPVNVNANQLLPNLNKSGLQNEKIISTAVLLTDTMRAMNKQMLEPKGKEINWRNWILWIVLVGAALLLVWMGVRLMKKMAD